MAENRTNQNPDWNQNGQPQANQDTVQHHDNRGHGGAQRQDSQQGEHDRTEGRDIPPSNPRPGGERDQDGPWLGGG